MCSFCTRLIDSSPPATMIGTLSTITRCAAIAIACRPDEQRRLTVVPAVVTGSPARSAAWRAMFWPVAPSGSAQPITTSSTSPGSIPARFTAWAMTWPPMAAPCVLLNAPRYARPIGVRAVETMTASAMGLSLCSWGDGNIIPGAMGVHFFAALVVDGALAGALYALVALSFVVVYRASRMINFAVDKLVAAAVAATCTAVVAWVVHGSRTGVALRAIADDQQAAMSAGIDLHRYFAITWALMGVVSVLAGTLWTLVAGGGLGIVLVGLKVFPIVIIGGLDSIPGTVVGALGVGVLESLAAGYLDPLLGGGFSNIASYLVLLAALFVRPYGLFGRPDVRRV